MSYANHTLQNDALASFAPALRQTGVRQIVNASPLSMGLLRSSGPQDWHPAPPELRAASVEASTLCKQAYHTTLERVSLGFGLGSFDPDHQSNGAVVVGCGSVGEVEECMEVWNALYGPVSRAQDHLPQNGNILKLDQKAAEADVRAVFVNAGVANWSWPTNQE